MIDILIKFDQQCVIVTEGREIFHYNQPVHKVMDLFLKPLLLSYQSLQMSSKQILGSNQYKRPISYYSSRGLNVLLPLHSSRDETCIWVSYRFCMTYTLADFNELTQQSLTQFHWDRLLSRAVTYKNQFDLNIEVPTFGVKVDEDQFKQMMRTK